MKTPETSYARSGDLHIAYQVFGDGPVDLVLVWGYVSHVEGFWNEPLVARFLRRLGSFSRVIHFDRRGLGMSDRMIGAPTLEQRMDDVRAVMDAAGSERAVILTISEGAPLGAMFAATYPERVEALVMYGAMVRVVNDADWQFGFDREVYDDLVSTAQPQFGTPDTISIGLFAPSCAADEAFRQRWARLERSTSSPGDFRRLFEQLADLDMRGVLPAIVAPTCIIHRVGDLVLSIEQARYAASAIPVAKLVELPGDDHFAFCGDSDAVLDSIEEFVTGAPPHRASERSLGTVLFTDIVSSTEQLSTVGDRAWRDILDAHDNAMSEQISRHQGRFVKSTGDGVLAVFDGPSRAVECALALRHEAGLIDLQIRTGLHTAEVERRGDDVAGLAVHIAARIQGLAEPGDILVSRTLTDLVAGSGLRFEARGEHQLKGVEGTWPVYAVA